MRKQKNEKKENKRTYEKPDLTKHEKLTRVTGEFNSIG